MPTVLDSLNAGLRHAFDADPSVYHLGEDILDPYGGAFKVTRGLSTAYPNRVLTSPVSEAGIVGIAAGMALRGLRPVVEIMFGDFLTLAADQLVNHIAKFRWMYNDQVRVPLVIRTPMGGRRGYGPTHSQTLEKLFMGIPGLLVVAPTALGDPGSLLARTILETESPVLFVENKLLYLLPLQENSLKSEFEYHELNDSINGEVHSPAYRLSVRGAPKAQVTIAAYGYMAELARQAMLKLAYDCEVFAELFVPTQLAPFDMGSLLESLNRTRRLLTVEESTFTLGWGAEIVALSCEALGSHLRTARRLAAVDTPVPASPALEQRTLPSVEQIIDTCLEMARGR